MSDIGNDGRSTQPDEREPGPTVTLTLPADLARRFADAAEELSGMVIHVENAFALFHRLLSDGDLDGHKGLISMALLASRALKPVSDREAEDMMLFGERLNAARAERAEP